MKGSFGGTLLGFSSIRDEVGCLINLVGDLISYFVKSSFFSRRILTVFEYSLGLLHRSGVLFYLVICLRQAPQLRCKPYSSLADSKTLSITLNCVCRTVV